MKRKLRKKIKVSHVLLILVLLLVTVVSVFPFYCMLIMGTHSINDLFKGIHLLPGKYLAQNWKTLFTVPILTYYKNSFVAGFASMFICLFTSTTCGYGLAKYRFRGRKTIRSLVMALLMIPTQLGLIAYVIEMRMLGLTGTLWPVILPYSANAFGVFWMHSFISQAIPDEVIESGRLDGCGEYRIFWQLSLPFIRPALVTLALLSFLWSWNALLVPLVTLNKEALFTLPLGIKGLATGFRNDYGAQILGLSVGTLPILFFFSFFSKNLINGLASVAVKG